MRFLDLSASAIAAAALLQGAVAAEQPQGYGAAELTTSAATTYYTTMTVYRVATTVTATRHGSLTAYPTTGGPSTLVPSATLPSYGNSTNVHPGAAPSTTGVEASPGAASGLQVCSMAVALAAGVVGLLVI